MFILSRKACFLTRTSPNIFSGCILYKTKRYTKFQIFDQNHALTTLQKCQFCGFLKPLFLLFRKACSLDKTSKIVFHDLFPRFMTWEYRGLQRGYGGKQGVTRGYKGLQGVTRGDRG